MTRDYGVRSRSRSAPIGAIALAIGVVFIVAVSAVVWLRQRAAAIKLAEAWTIAGAPCPAVSGQALAAAGLMPAGDDDSMVTTFDNVRVVRASGYVSCADIAYDGGRGFDTYPVCQFPEPRGLVVTTPSGVYYFAPGYGHPATVSVPHGRPVCVMAAKFHASLKSIAAGDRPPTGWTP